MMAVSSLKGCWSKLSARIRDYIDVVDSYYRPNDELADSTNTRSRTPNVDLRTGRLHSHHHSHNQPHNNHNHHHHHHNHSHNYHLNQHHLHHNHLNNPQNLHSISNVTSTTNKTKENPIVASATSHKERRSSNTGNKPNCQDYQLQLHHHDQDCSSYRRTIRQLLALEAIQNQSSLPSSSTTPRSAAALGYTKRKTAQGQVYFVDQNGHKNWYDPSVPKELLNATLDLDYLVGALDQLPHDWEVSRTSTGKVYFINHTKKTTQFTDPRLILYKNELLSHIKRNATSHELYDKISILRQELLKQQVLSHPCRIEINRKKIFEESFKAVTQMQPRDLKKRLLIKFKGEEGLDYGGVAREWFYLLSRAILNPVHGLFQYTGDDNYNLQINPDSKIVYKEHLSYMNFCGRIIGMAVFHGHYIEGRFTLPFYKMLVRKPITLNDIEFVDPDLHRSLNWMLDNDITDVIDTTFLIQHNAFGQLQEHELKPNGRNIQVTEENKQDYVNLYVNYRCRRGIESQFSALQLGFYEIIQSNLVENFDEHELELLIGGLSKIDIDDWSLNTKLKNCTVETPLVRWFWDIVKSYDEDKRARLLQFVTGSPRVPIQGFKALQGVNSELRLFTIHLIRNGNTNNLPKSHTCFNRVDLPPYETYDKLRDKLTQAIEETMGFGMQ